MIYNTICCITSESLFKQAELLCLDIQKYLNVKVDIANTKDFPIQNFDVILYVHSQKSSQSYLADTLLKIASDLNKTFVPVIVDSSFWGDLLIEFGFRGPNLRTPFLSIRKRKDLFEMYNRIASYSGVKLVGDPVGAKYTLVSDYDCKIHRSGETIAEVKANQPTTINLYYGCHKLVAIPKVDKKIKKEFALIVDTIDCTYNYSLFVGKNVTFFSDFDCFVYQNTRLVGSLTANKPTTISLLHCKSKIRFQVESSRLRNKYDHAVQWNGSEDSIKVKLKKRFVGKTDSFGISKSDYATYRQMSAQKEALQKKIWRLPPKEQKKLQIEIDKIDTKINKLKQRINKDKN